MNRSVGSHSTRTWCGALLCLVAIASVAKGAEPRASLTLSTKISAPPIPVLSTDESDVRSSVDPSPFVPEVSGVTKTPHSKPWIMEAHPLPYVEREVVQITAVSSEPPEPVIPPTRPAPPKLTRSAAIVQAATDSSIPAKPILQTSLPSNGKGIPRAFARTGNVQPSNEAVASTPPESVTVESLSDSMPSSPQQPRMVTADTNAPDKSSVMLPALAPPNAASLPAASPSQVAESKPIAPAYVPSPTPLPSGPIIAAAPPAITPVKQVHEAVDIVKDSEPQKDSASDEVVAELKIEAMKQVAAVPSEPIGTRPARLSARSVEQTEILPTPSESLRPAEVAKAVPKPITPRVNDDGIGQLAADTIAAMIPMSSASKVELVGSLKPSEITDEPVVSNSIAQTAGSSPPVNSSTSSVVNAVAMIKASADESKSIQQVGCSSCGQAEPLPRPDESSVWSGSSMDESGGCMSCGAGRGPCTPGQIPCAECDVHTPAGRMMAELYHCICCPDPCYEPRWIALANAAITVDPIRPQTHQTFRWDFMNGLRTPDRAEYYFGRYAAYAGDGPLPPTPPPTAPPYVDTSVEFNELTSYSEAALKKFGVFVEVPYRSIDPNVSNSAAGFSDIKVGTKSVVFDCELLQVAIQFKTYIPSGVSFQGLGTGHATLEPSVLVGMKLHPDVYFQGQLGEWIPFSADATQAGAILRVNASLNALLWCLNRDVQLIGTLEANTWSFQDGQYINPYLNPANPATYAINASGQTYGWMGPGARLSICNRIDFGMATMFGFGDRSWSDFGLRMEMRTMF